MVELKNRLCNRDCPDVCRIVAIVGAVVALLVACSGAQHPIDRDATRDGAVPVHWDDCLVSCAGTVHAFLDGRSDTVDWIRVDEREPGGTLSLSLEQTGGTVAIELFDASGPLSPTPTRWARRARRVYDGDVLAFTVKPTGTTFIRLSSPKPVSYWLDVRFNAHLDLPLPPSLPSPTSSPSPPSSIEDAEAPRPPGAMNLAIVKVVDSPSSHLRLTVDAGMEQGLTTKWRGLVVDGKSQHAFRHSEIVFLTIGTDTSDVIARLRPEQLDAQSFVRVWPEL